MIYVIEVKRFWQTLIRLFLVFLIFLAIFLFLPKNVFAVYTISVNNLPQSINTNSQQDVGLEMIVKLGKSSEYYLRTAFSYPNSPSAYFGYTDGYNGTEAKSFYKITTNDNGEWGGILKIGTDVSSSYFKGEGNYNFKIGYYTAAGNGPTWKYENTIFLAYLPSSLTPTKPVLSPALTITPTLSSTPTSKLTATYKINEVKDEDGNVLSSVKVYVDGVYIHHYVPEVLTFCDGCQCNTYVDCGYGEHVIMLEKSGFDNWNEVVIVNAGYYKEANPVMSLSDSVLPTSTFTPTPTYIPTLTPTPTLKAVAVSATFSGEILGNQSSESGSFYALETTPSADLEEKPKEDISLSFLPKVILVSGMIFLLSGGLWLWYNLKH